MQYEIIQIYIHSLAELLSYGCSDRPTWKIDT